MQSITQLKFLFLIKYKKSINKIYLTKQPPLGRLARSNETVRTSWIFVVLGCFAIKLEPLWLEKEPMGCRNSHLMESRAGVLSSHCGGAKELWGRSRRG
jgi:hypothetical protein